MSSSTSPVQLVSLLPEQDEYLHQLAQRWGLSLEPVESDYLLQLDESGLGLVDKTQPKLNPIQVDFVGGAVGHRRKFGGGRGQAIAKAVGLKSGVTPSVLDATAGLGRDAFVLASLGCKVTLIERHPVVAALLDDGLKRAAQDPDIGDMVRGQMQLLHGASQQLLADIRPRPQVVYLDPMFPHKKKSALVKKEMRVFQSLVGADLDADELLPAALELAECRVVVKRPDYAPWLNEQKPSMSIETKKNRFDVYVKQAIPADSEA